MTLMLSVSGARGIVGETMTPDLAARFAGAFGSFLRESLGLARPVLCVGRDSRPSGPMIADAVRSGLRGAGCDVVDLGVVMTPTVGVMIDHHQAHGGVVITASHNPIQWNGMKCLNPDGISPPPADADRVIERFRNNDVAWVEVDALGSETHDDSASRRHIDRVLAAVDPEPIRAAGFTVVLDSVNGAGCLPGRMLLEALGCTVVHLNGEPTGQFAHTPEPIERNLGELIEATPRHDGMVGFAQDPDADRLAIVDDQGRYIGEEYTLVLAASQALTVHGAGPMAANLSTSRMIDDIAAGVPGASVLRTAVGEAHVVNALKPAGGVIGGEGNGGVVYPPVCWVRDSLSAMALVLGLMAQRGEPLHAIVNRMPRYEIIKQSFDLSDIGGRDAVGDMIANVRARFADERINDADGVRIDFEEGWVHLRPSNTEPILRLIAEAMTRSQAAILMDRVRSVIGRLEVKG